MSRRDSESARLSALRPPLRLLCTIDYGHRVNWLPLSRGGRLYVGFPEGTCAVDERSAERLWKNAALEYPLLFIDGKLLAQRKTGIDRQVLDVVDPHTGRVERTLLDWPAVSDLTPQGDLLACVKYDDTAAVCGVDFKNGKVRWRWSPPQGTFIVARLIAGQAAVYVCLDDGSVIALDVDTGKIRWRHTIADVTWDNVGKARAGHARDTASLIGDRLIVDAQGGWVVGLSTKDGRRAWSHRCRGDLAQSAVRDGVYHVLALPGALVSLDPRSGREISSVDLHSHVPKRTVPVRRLTHPLWISEDHVFTGSEEGFVLGFERGNGKYVWSLRPKGAATTGFSGSRFAAAAGRLFYSDMSNRVYCLEEDHSAPTVRRRKARTAAKRRRS